MPFNRINVFILRRPYSRSSPRIKMGRGRLSSLTTFSGKQQYHHALNSVYSSYSLYRQESRSRMSRPCFREFSAPPFQAAPFSTWTLCLSRRSMAPPTKAPAYSSFRRVSNVQVLTRA